MPKTCPISPSLRPLNLDSIWAHDISSCEYKQVIPPDEDETSAIFANEQSRVPVTTHEGEIMQQTD